MSSKMKAALAAVIALGVIAGLVFFTPLGGPLSPGMRHLESEVDRAYDAMRACINEEGWACTEPALRGGELAFDAGGRINPACLAATYEPGGAHSVNVRLAPAGCYIGAAGGEFCIAVKGGSDATHCVDSSGRDKRNSYCLVTGVCTD